MKYYSGDEVNKNEIGGGGGRGIWKGDIMEDLGLNWRIILKRIFERWNGGHGLN